jgi:protein-disulfide isomerase
MRVALGFVLTVVLAAAPASAGAQTPLSDELAGRNVDLAAIAHSPADGAAPRLGPERALVTVVIFSDFQCPVCLRSAHPIKQLVVDFPGQVKVVFRHNPLSIHRYAQPAALAAVAAQQQGKFWEYHDRLFDAGGRLEEADLERYARDLGLDVGKWGEDVAAPTTTTRVQEEASWAVKMGAPGTPALFVNGVRQNGWSSYPMLHGLVAREIAEARKLADAGTPLAKVHREMIRRNAGEEGARWAEWLDAK